MSDTPRTDEAQFGTGRVSVDFARTLERELNAANQRIKRLKGELESTKADRDSWSNQSDEFAKTAADLIIHIKRLEACNEYLRQKIGKLDDRIRHLIRLGLATTRPEDLDQWQEEEEL